MFFYKYELNKWVDLRIIKNLTLLFKEDLGGLSKLAADILTDISYISERQQN